MTSTQHEAAPSEDGAGLDSAMVELRGRELPSAPQVRADDVGVVVVEKHARVDKSVDDRFRGRVQVRDIAVPSVGEPYGDDDVRNGDTSHVRRERVQLRGVPHACVSRFFRPQCMRWLALMRSAGAWKAT